MGIVMGTALGFLSGLGIGGGSLLVMYLTLALGMDPQTARGINLLFYLPCAALAAWLRWKDGSVAFKPLLPAIAAGCGAGGIFSWVGMNLDTALLKKGFGILLLLTGLREITYRPRKAR